MSARSLYGIILARRLAERDEPAGRMFNLDKAQALVISVASGEVLEGGVTRLLRVKAGDRVLIRRDSGDEVKLDGTDHVILREDHILAIVNQ